MSAKVGKHRQIIPTVEIIDGTKHFGYHNRWKPILKKFNMAAFSGEIFVLLGPCGCGKSTVINVILGIKRLNKGQVTVFGFKPKQRLSGIPGMRVGYTPQSNGLHPELTINETFRYYGALLRLKRSYVLARIIFVQNLLSLPNGRRYIRSCTESVKRQVSFGLAILHEPELLVLDEPTVGVNPVLRKHMWDHMRMLASAENRTIVITSQSCDEASMADTIGIMRSGYLLMQGNPKDLLVKYKEKDLDTIYMKIYALTIGMDIKQTSSIQENPLISLDKLNVTASEGFLYTGEENEDNTQPKPPKNRKSQTESLKQFCTCCPHFIRIFVLMYRDTIRIVRNYVWMTLFILLPAIFILILGFTIGTNPTSIPLGIINYEPCRDNEKTTLGCQLVKSLEKSATVNLSFYKNGDDAIKAAKRLEIQGVLKIGRKFTEFINNKMSMKVLGGINRRNLFEESQLILRMDHTSRTAASAIENELCTVIDVFFYSGTDSTDAKKAFSTYPLKIGSPLFGAKETPVMEFIALGFAVILTYYNAASLAAITFITDRKNKLTARNRLAGVRLIETIISQMVIYGLLMILQSVLIFFCLFMVCDVPNQGCLWILALIVIVHIWCGLAFGMFTSMLVRTNISAGVLIFCCLGASIILCDIIWPAYGLPEWLRNPVAFLPHTPAAEALRCVVQRGVSITHQKVWLGIAVPLGWMLLFIIISILINTLSN